jgi:hypothetical protein
MESRLQMMLIYFSLIMKKSAEDLKFVISQRVLEPDRRKAAIIRQLLAQLCL